MKVKIDNCVGCALPCTYSCPYLDEGYEYICDDCGEETQLYEFDGKELCIDCIERRLEKIN